MPAVVRAARILATNPADADHLAQDTMLKAFRSLDSFTDGTDAKAWLMTILRNTRTDRLRAAASAGRHVRLDDLGADPPDCSSDAAEWRQLGDDPEDILQEFSDHDVIRALQSLP